MNFEESADIAFRVNDVENTAKFFRDILGYKLTKPADDFYKVETEQFNLFLTSGDKFSVVLEFYVEDLEVAKKQCLNAGY